MEAGLQYFSVNVASGPLGTSLQHKQNKRTVARIREGGAIQERNELCKAYGHPETLKVEIGDILHRVNGLLAGDADHETLSTEVSVPGELLLVFARKEELIDA